MFELSPNEAHADHRSQEDTMAATPTRRRTAVAKPAPEPVEIETDEFEEIEDDEPETGDDSELEELDEEDEDTPAPKARKATKSTKAAPSKAPATPNYNTAWLASFITETTGKSYDGRSTRMLLRKLAADGKLARNVGEDRDRYTFPLAAKDPIVMQVIAMIDSGEAAALKQAGLQAVKDKAAEKKAAAKLAQESAADDEIEEEDEAPAPKRRTATKTAPAKATPVRRARAAASK